MYSYTLNGTWFLAIAPQSGKLRSVEANWIMARPTVILLTPLIVALTMAPHAAADTNDD